MATKRIFNAGLSNGISLAGRWWPAYSYLPSSTIKWHWIKNIVGTLQFTSICFCTCTYWLVCKRFPNVIIRFQASDSNRFNAQMLVTVAKYRKDVSLDCHLSLDIQISRPWYANLHAAAISNVWWQTLYEDLRLINVLKWIITNNCDEHLFVTNF